VQRTPNWRRRITGRAAARRRRRITGSAWKNFPGTAHTDGQTLLPLYIRSHSNYLTKLTIETLFVALGIMEISILAKIRWVRIF
jgi:hypothetical protein